MKSCVADIAANFTTNRMLTDYQERYYSKLWARTLEMRKDDYDMARRIAAWKRRVSAAWDKVRIVSVQQFDVGREAIMVNTPYRIEAVVDVDGLDAQDIGVELIISHHPVIFNPLRTVRPQNIIYALVQSGIAVISAHTNLDMAYLYGVNDALCRKLGLQTSAAF